MPIIHIMLVTYQRLFMGSNKLLELGTSSSAPFYYLSALSYSVLTRPSLFTLALIALLYFLVYVDDLIITGSDPSLVNNIIRQLDSKFSTKNLGVLSYFNGVEILPTSTSLPLSQQRYVIDLLSKHNMLNSKPVSTSLSVGISLTTTNGVASVNATIYRQMQ